MITWENAACLFFGFVFGWALHSDVARRAAAAADQAAFRIRLREIKNAEDLKRLMDERSAD